MPRAEWNGVQIASSDKTITVEDYSVYVNGAELADAAWYYPSPKSAANNITRYIAFYKGVKVSA
ncbi:hypothetical protein HDU97_007759 [Phlyctochytrium planicorne]|nr:hypothetical protein HDU97_007759 [Phlyctochytrium planicorne]